METSSPKQFTDSVDVFRRRLLLQQLPATPNTPNRASQRPQPLQVLLDGFLQGSLLTLAVCTPKRRSVFSRETARRRESFRTFLVSKPPAPAHELPARKAEPVAR
jgi:hypothetical protein